MRPSRSAATRCAPASKEVSRSIRNTPPGSPHPRRNVRIQWWQPAQTTTYRELAIWSDELREQLPEVPLSHDARSPYDNAKPVFFGHYWMKGAQRTQTPKVACVDYSAADDGPLVAYRWDGEADLTNDNFQQVG